MRVVAETQLAPLDERFTRRLETFGLAAGDGRHEQRRFGEQWLQIRGKDGRDLVENAVARAREHRIAEQAAVELAELVAGLAEHFEPHDRVRHCHLPLESIQ